MFRKVVSTAVTIVGMNCRQASSSVFGNKIGIVGCPFSDGQQINSCTKLGPEAVRDGGLIKEIKDYNG